MWGGGGGGGKLFNFKLCFDFLHEFCLKYFLFSEERTVIPRLTKIIRSGITCVSRNVIVTHIQTEKVSSWNGPTVHVCCFMLTRTSTKRFVSRVRKTAKKIFFSRKIL